MHAHVHMTDPIILWGRDEYTEDQSIYWILCIKDHTYTGTRFIQRYGDTKGSIYEDTKYAQRCNPMSCTKVCMSQHERMLPYYVLS